MTYQQYTDILNSVDAYCLEAIETTSERNGYPSNLREAITGFDNFEEAQDFARENGLDLIVIDKRSGWKVWHRGGLVSEPFDLYSDYLSRTDGSVCFTNEDADEYLEVDFQETLMQKLSDGELSGFDEVRDFCNECESIHSEIEDLEDDEFLVVYGDGSYERKPKKSLSDYDDNKHVGIAAIFDGEFNEEEE